MAKKKGAHGGRRPGAGRPRKMHGSAVIAVSLPQRLLDDLEAYIVREGLNRSEAVVRGVELLLKKK